MPPADQLHLGEHPTDTTTSPRPFLTDEGIGRRLAQLRNGFAHLEAILPAMRREIDLLSAQFPKTTIDEG